MPSTKKLRYRALIEKVKASYAPYDASKREGELRLYWCDECQEIRALKNSVMNIWKMFASINKHTIFFLSRHISDCFF